MPAGAPRPAGAASACGADQPAPPPSQGHTHQRGWGGGAAEPALPLAAGVQLEGPRGGASPAGAAAARPARPQRAGWLPSSHLIDHVCMPPLLPSNCGTMALLIQCVHCFLRAMTAPCTVAASGHKAAGPTRGNSLCRCRPRSALVVRRIIPAGVHPAPPGLLVHSIPHLEVAHAAGAVVNVTVAALRVGGSKTTELRSSEQLGLQCPPPHTKPCSPSSAGRRTASRRRPRGQRPGRRPWRRDLADNAGMPWRCTRRTLPWHPSMRCTTGWLPGTRRGRRQCTGWHFRRHMPGTGRPCTAATEESRRSSLRADCCSAASAARTAPGARVRNAALACVHRPSTSP